MPIIYQHIRLDTLEVFYIGIGKQSNRAYSKQRRNKYWNNIVNKVGYKVEIIKEVDSWKDACKLEIELISKYGRKDNNTGSLVNMTNGGDGSKGMSEESRNSISEKMKIINSGSNNPMYGKTGNLNSFYGKKHTDESKLKNRLAHLNKKTRGDSHRAKKVIDTSNNTIYSCVIEAAEANNIRSGTLVNMLRGHRVNKTSLKYL